MIERAAIISQKSKQFRIYLPENFKPSEEFAGIFNRIENTNQCLEITGKAGTGKSTFLHYTVKNSKKKIVVLAPTGIAAINIGGSTIHSFFGFPFKPMTFQDEEIPVFQKNSPRRKLITNLDTIIIDEISMVRADIIDAIDYSLRINGGDKKKPFGGKQIILIGDLFQLPPVVRGNTEERFFNEYYKSPYFFSARIFQDSTQKELFDAGRPFNFHEFNKVYRHKDEQFINLLDRVKEGNLLSEELALLNKRYAPYFEPEKGEFIISLVPTNSVAEHINTKKLRDIPAEEFQFTATIEGNFSKDKYPAPLELELKEKAQIIFVRNDTEKRWVNGTLGEIIRLGDDFVEVKLDNGETYQVFKNTWENMKYTWDNKTKKIKTEIIGTYTQYPLKLAWAITIHKSQGLTFDDVIIDLSGGIFAHGQLYVALSRCRELKGIYLKRNIQKRDAIVDDRIIKYLFVRKATSLLQS